MPEGPEVRRYADMMNGEFMGQELRMVKINGGKYINKPFMGYEELTQTTGLKFIKCNCKGKVFNLEFANETTRGYLLVHLNMSGEWFVKSLEEKPKQIGDVNFHFENKMLCFSDKRQLGMMEYTTDVSYVLEKLGALGPDMLSDETTYEVFKARIKARPKSKIGNLLMDQHTISGVGNYLRADSLYYAKVSPFKPVSRMSEEEMKALYHAIKVVMWMNYKYDEGIKKKIITSKDVAQIKLMLGNEKYNELTTKVDMDTEPFFIYGKETDYLGYTVNRVSLNARTVHYVPQVQQD